MGPDRYKWVALSNATLAVLLATLDGSITIQHLLGSDVLSTLPAHDQAVLTGHSFFPTLISGPFEDGLHAAFLFAIVACLIAAAASLMRGGRVVEDEPAPVEPAPRSAQPTPV
jgi:hypothetical protein